MGTPRGGDERGQAQRRAYLRISLDATDGCTSLEVRDDGSGPGEGGAGTGLDGLAERVRAVGGTLALGSSEGRVQTPGTARRHHAATVARRRRAMIRVLLAEDQLMFRTAVRRLLELERDIEVVAAVAPSQTGTAVP